VSFKLNSLYVGKSLSVYELPWNVPQFKELEVDNKYYLASFKEKTDYIKRLGMQWWYPGRSQQLPTHYAQDGDEIRYIIDPRSEPRRDIVLLKEKDIEGKYVPIFCEARGEEASRLFRVPEIPKLFDWYGRGFLVRVEDVYLDVPEESIPNLPLDFDDLRQLEDLGIPVFPMHSFRWDRFFAVGYGMPLPMWLKALANNSPFPSVCGHTVASPYFELYEKSVPCQVDAESIQLFYIEDNQGQFWTSRGTRAVSQEEAVALWGLPNSGTVRYLTDTDYIEVPIEEVLEVGQDDHLGLCHLFYGRVVLRVASLDYSTNLRGMKKFPACLSKLVLKNPMPVRDSQPSGQPGLWLVNADTEPRSFGLVKVKRGQETKRAPFRLGYVQDGYVHLLAGCYCQEEHVLPYRRITRADYEALDLQYELPGRRWDWQMEDLIQYNELLSKNLYGEVPRIQLGSVLVPLTKDFAFELNWPTLVFISKKRNYHHRVWQTLSWQECITFVEKRDIPSTEKQEDANDALLTALALGVDPQMILDLLAERYRLPEAERLLLDSVPESVLE
jgi:hypothetical protein